MSITGIGFKITPSVKGQATIYDKDILIYCISQIIAKLKKSEPISQRVRISSRDLLIFTNRGTAGKDYIALVGSAGPPLGHAHQHEHPDGRRRAI